MPFNTIIKGICQEQLSKSKICLIYSQKHTTFIFFKCKSMKKI